jgi:hypothetical protein
MVRADILDLFASYSEPDEFTAQYQLELFAWARVQHGTHSYGTYINHGCRCDICRADYRRYIRGKRYGATVTRSYHCGQCGEDGHNARTCSAEQRAA